jgi:hypothetical protein
MKLKFFILPLLLILTACVTTETGKQELSPVGEAALQASVSIAVRHYIADSPKAQARAANIRKVVEQVKAVAGAESTLAALRDVVAGEIDRLNLSELDRADALTLLDLVAVALEAKLGDRALNSEGLLRVADYLDIILKAIPPTTGD